MVKSKKAKPTVEYSSEALSFFSDRRIDTHASFLLPFLEQGLTILDCGCGPGTLTLDIADLVSPGGVTGIDISMTQIETAKSIQSQRKVENAGFELGDVNSLSYPEESFDLVFAHGVIEYLKDPVHAFREIRRVLTREGIIAVRHADWGGFLLAPEDNEVALFIDLFKKLMVHDGADLFFGRNQISYLRQAGYKIKYVSASYDCWTPTPEITLQVAKYMASHCLSDEFVKPVQDLNLADQATLNRIHDAFIDWGNNPDAFAAEAWSEVIASKI